MPAECMQPPAPFARMFNALLPRRCPLCAARVTRDFCADCLRLLPAITAACKTCGVELPAPGICGACQSQAPRFYDYSVIPFKYCAPVSEQIRLLKYKEHLRYAAALGAMIGSHARVVSTPMPDVLMPVPLHHKRLRRRGFNQALEIARHIGRELNIKIEYRELRRIKNTVPQVGLNHTARQKNVRNAFHAAPLAFSHVALVDDVVTSGSTVNDAARALKRAGVETVSVWAAAKTVADG